MYSRKEPYPNARGTGTGTGTSTGIGAGTVKLLFVLAWLVACVMVQQWYARTHHPCIEQPAGLLGLTEYLFRHPEEVLCLFKYQRVEIP